MKEVIDNIWNFLWPIMPEVAIGVALACLTILVLWLAVIIFSKMGETFGQGSITLVAIIVVSTFWYLVSNQKVEVYRRALESIDTENVELDTNSVASVTQVDSTPPEVTKAINLTGRKAIISWVLPPGQKSRGRDKESGLPAVIVHDDDNRMEVEYSYNYNGQSRVGRFVMKKKGDELVGSWHQQVPFDKGEVGLKKADEPLTWSGWQTDLEGNRPEVRLVVK